MGMLVKLSLVEFNVAVQSATARTLVSTIQNLNHASTYKRTWLTRLQEEVIGCLVELAMGKLLGLYLIPEIGTYHHKPDCLHDIELRGTAYQDGKLIVRDNDASDRRYVLATVTGELVHFCGWCYGYEAKQAKYLDNPNGYRDAWMVPQDDLRPFGSLELATVQDATQLLGVAQPVSAA